MLKGPFSDSLYGAVRALDVKVIVKQLAVTQIFYGICPAISRGKVSAQICMEYDKPYARMDVADYLAWLVVKALNSMLSRPIAIMFVHRRFGCAVMLLPGIITMGTTSPTA